MSHFVKAGAVKIRVKLICVAWNKNCATQMSLSGLGAMQNNWLDVTLPPPPKRIGASFHVLGDEVGFYSPGIWLFLTSLLRESPRTLVVG